MGSSDGRRRRAAGFSLIEMMVALVLAALVGTVAMGLLTPLRATRASASETQALTYARSYAELLKARWLRADAFNRADVPRLEGADAEVKVPAPWALTVEVRNEDGKAPRSDDLLRRVRVRVTRADGPPVELLTLVARP